MPDHDWNDHCAAGHEMKPRSEWIESWRIGVAPFRESEVSGELLSLFIDFWNAESIGDRSKTTRNRYSGALHALGGYLIEQAISEEGMDMTADELCSEHVGPDEGPLIYWDNEAWQNEIDVVCRKLYRYMRRMKRIR